MRAAKGHADELVDEGSLSSWAQQSSASPALIPQSRKLSREGERIGGGVAAEFGSCPRFPRAGAPGAVGTPVPAAASAGAGGAGPAPYPRCYSCLLFDFRCCLVGLVKSSLSVK